MANQKSAVARRLRWYWPMEAANAAIVPALAVSLVWSSSGVTTAALWVSAIACSVLLVIGALYWRAALRRLEGAPNVFDYWIQRLAAVEGLSLALACLAVGVTIWEFWSAGWTWNNARTAAVVLTTLAALEFVNYYRVQLQHFDNWADFKRLVTGRGFRAAHMARDIAEWRSRARAGQKG
jgi:hypothetical protein